MEHLQKFCSWAFTTDQKDPKHTTLAHPLFSAVLGTLIFSIGIFKISSFFINRYTFLRADTPKWSKLYLGPALIVYLIGLILSRYIEKGAWTLYDVLWGCNSSLIFFLYGIYSNRSFIISIVVLVIALDQIMWYVDLIGYLISGKFLIGVVKYLFWKETPLSNIITSTHHIWFIPIGIMLVLKTQKPISWQSYKASCMVSFMWCVVSRALTPFKIELPDGVKYMNVNSSYEPWKDVKFSWFRYGDGLNIIGFLIWETVVWNSLNFFLYVFIKIGVDLATSKKKLL